MENVDGVNAAGAGNVMFGTVETWIMYNLTGGRDGGIHVTDGELCAAGRGRPPPPTALPPLTSLQAVARALNEAAERLLVPARAVSNASRTMLLDLRSCDWSEDMLGKFGMHKSMLPKVVSNAEVYGHVR